MILERSLKWKKDLFFSAELKEVALISSKQDLPSFTVAK